MSHRDEQEVERGKKRYTKPEIVYQQLLEAMAVACTTVGGKADAGSPNFCTTLFS